MRRPLSGGMLYAAKIEALEAHEIKESAMKKTTFLFTAPSPPILDLAPSPLL